MSLLIKGIPPVSNEFILTLDAAFPAIQMHQLDPSITREELFLNAGHRQVIEWIKAKALRETTVNGRPL
jgi:hypothetical protein